jgi:hypothetical protein
LNSNNECDFSHLKNFKIVGSYNWAIDSKPDKPVMVIPGEQGYLSNDFSKLEQLTKINYLYIDNRNAVEFPDYPIEPIYHSILQCTPDFEFENVDVILDNLTLGHLLKFVEKQDFRSIKNVWDQFRLDFQRIGNSIVILTHERGLSSNDYYKDFVAKKSQGYKGKFLNTKNSSFLKYKITRNSSI